MDGRRYIPNTASAESASRQSGTCIQYRAYLDDRSVEQQGREVCLPNRHSSTGWLIGTNYVERDIHAKKPAKATRSRESRRRCPLGRQTLRSANQARGASN